MYAGTACEFGDPSQEIVIDHVSSSDQVLIVGLIVSAVAGTTIVTLTASAVAAGISKTAVGSSIMIPDI